MWPTDRQTDRPTDLPATTTIHGIPATDNPTIPAAGSKRPAAKPEEALQK